MSANRFDQIIALWEPRLKAAFNDAIYGIRNAAQIEQIVRMLESGDVDGALRAVGLDPLQFRALEKAIYDAYEGGGNYVAKSIPALRDPNGISVVFRFAVRNVIAEAWLRDYSAALIRDILEDQRYMVRQFLSYGLSQGLNPRSVALDLVGRINRLTKRREGGLIGLTSSQEEWVRSYADALASDNPLDALSRSLRDKRFDAVVRSYVAQGKPIPADKIDAMVAAYKNRALRYRGENIARTETLRALHEAQQEAIRQAIESGQVAAKDVTMIWRTAKDNRVRDSHRAMNGQRVSYGSSFTSGNGVSIRFPCDARAPANETINCRCFCEASIDFLSGIK